MYSQGLLSIICSIYCVLSVFRFSILFRLPSSYVFKPGDVRDHHVPCYLSANFCLRCTSTVRYPVCSCLALPVTVVCDPYVDRGNSVIIIYFYFIVIVHTPTTIQRCVGHTTLYYLRSVPYNTFNQYLICIRYNKTSTLHFKVL